LIAFTFLVIILFGCTEKKEAPLSKSEAQPETKARWTIGMSQCNLGEPWRVQMNLDVKNAAEKSVEGTALKT
jgi:ribose transport system substrate-binding protein